MEEPVQNEDLGQLYFDLSSVPTQLLCLAIIIVMFASLRLVMGSVAHVSADDELARKDNPAFGISLAGVVLGLTIVLGGVIPSSWTMSFNETITMVAVYGVTGILMMFVTRFIFDRAVLPRFSMRDEIIKGNIAVAIIDAGNMVTSALVISAVTRWISTDSMDGLLSLLLVYAMSQAILTLVGVAHVRFFAKYHRGRSLLKEFYAGNTALALRFVGRRIGAAFAITAASHQMVYELYEPAELIAPWTLVSLGFILAVTILSWLATRFIFFGINVNDEVINQRNIAIGAVQCAIYIALGFIVASLMS